MLWGGYFSKVINGLGTTVAVMSLLCFFISCSPKVYPTETKDSVRVEYRERVVKDSVYFNVPVEVERIVTFSDSSHLENRWAKSDAVVDTLGKLHHSLESIPQKVYVPYEVTVTDTLIVEKHAETIVQEVNRLTKWQSFEIVWARILSCLLAIAIIIFAIRLYLKFR